MNSQPSILLLILLFTGQLTAQSVPAEQSVSLEGVEHVSIKMNFSSVSIQSGNTASMLIHHQVTQNGEDLPSLRELDIQQAGQTLLIKELSPNVEAMKKRFPKGFRSTMGQTVFGEMEQKGQPDNAAQAVVETHLIVTLPASVTIDVETLYGGIRVENVSGLKRAYAEYGAIDVITSGQKRQQMELTSQYGTVDVSLPGSANADLKLQTEYGALYTDFEISVDENDSKTDTFLEKLIGQVGRGGQLISCHAPYGNVYLRKSK